MTKTEKINFKKMQISEIKDFLNHLEEYQKTSDETWLDIDPDTGIKVCDDTSDGEHYSHFDRIYTCLEDYMKILQDEIDELEKKLEPVDFAEIYGAAKLARVVSEM